MPPNVLVHGSGAIGAIYIYLLLQAGCTVTAVCRSNYTAAKTDGFTLDSDKYGQNIRFHPNVVRSPEEAASHHGPFDFIVVSTKAFPGQEASTPEILKPAVTAGKTTIVLIQNGIGIEAEYATAFPTNPVLSCVVYLPTTQTSPGHIHMGAIEQLQIGTFPALQELSSPAWRAAQHLQAFLTRGGGNVEVHEDIPALAKTAGQRVLEPDLRTNFKPRCSLPRFWQHGRETGHGRDGRSRRDSTSERLRRRD
jgi:2-dehydropantoate 2-reductase